MARSSGTGFPPCQAPHQLYLDDTSRRPAVEALTPSSSARPPRSFDCSARQRCAPTPAAATRRVARCCPSSRAARRPARPGGERCRLRGGKPGGLRGFRGGLRSKSRRRRPSRVPFRRRLARLACGVFPFQPCFRWSDRFKNQSRYVAGLAAPIRGGSRRSTSSGLPPPGVTTSCHRGRHGTERNQQATEPEPRACDDRTARLAHRAVGGDRFRRDPRAECGGERVASSASQALAVAASPPMRPADDGGSHGPHHRQLGRCRRRRQGAQPTDDVRIAIACANDSRRGDTMRRILHQKPTHWVVRLPTIPANLVPRRRPRRPVDRRGGRAASAIMCRQQRISHLSSIVGRASVVRGDDSRRWGAICSRRITSTGSQRSLAVHRRAPFQWTTACIGADANPRPSLMTTCRAEMAARAHV